METLHRYLLQTHLVWIINATIGNYSNSTNITILGSVDMYVMQYPWYYDTVNWI